MMSRSFVITTGTIIVISLTLLYDSSQSSSSSLYVTEAFIHGSQIRRSLLSQRLPSSSSSSSVVALSLAAQGKKDLSVDDIRSELSNYLKIREQQQKSTVVTENHQQQRSGPGLQTDEGQSTKRVVGGTKGNVVLEFVSGAPVKETIIDQPSNIFDYDELSKYGFDHLVTPIMDLGGRPAAYKLMDMQMPAVQLSADDNSSTNPPRTIVIDRTGENDSTQYKGLSMNQDDDEIARALERAAQKKRLDNVVVEQQQDGYQQPFADKRNTSPLQTPDWTTDRLDEYGRQQGRVQEWARRSKMGEFVKDPAETLDLSLSTRFYIVATLWLLAISFGRSTSTFLLDTTGWIESKDAVDQFVETLEVPALALGLANIGSAIVCGLVLAPSKNRNAFVWIIKGLCGGPLAIRQLRELETLITYQQQQDEEDRSQI